MVEDEDLRCAGSVPVSQHQCHNPNALNDLHILEQLLRLRVINLLDLLVVREGLLLALVPMNLEPMLVKGILVFMARDIGDGDREPLDRTIVAFRPPNVAGSRRSAIAGIFIVVQHRLNVMRPGSGRGYGWRRAGGEGGRLMGGLDCCGHCSFCYAMPFYSEAVE